MSNRRLVALGFAVMAFGFVAGSAEARSIRVDGGSWDVFSFMMDSTQPIGFDFLGIPGNSADISTNGSVGVSSAAGTLQLSPFFDPNQSGGGNSVQYEVGTTNANFNQTGIDAGFRVTWQVKDDPGPAGVVLNLFQLVLWEFSDNSFGFEFDYDAITFGSDQSFVGFTDGGANSFDLLATLGLSFPDFEGVGAGLDGLTSTCAADPEALACNNFYFTSMAFGPDASVLPDIANGYFRIVDGNDINDDGIVDPAQGRYLFPGNGAVQVPEPTTLTLLAIGLVGMGWSLRKQIA